MPNGRKEVKIHLPPQLIGGAYANLLHVSHTKEEFIMDFGVVTGTPPVGAITARVICSPGHMKRIVGALQDNILKYEKKFASVEAAEEPKGKIRMGFKTG